MTDFSEKLKQLRMEKDILQVDMANLIGVSVQSYSAYENGREPNYDILCKLAHYFDCTTDYLLGLSDYKNEQEMNTFFDEQTWLTRYWNDISQDSKGYIQDMITSVLSILPPLERDEKDKLGDYFLQTVEFVTGKLSSATNRCYQSRNADVEQKLLSSQLLAEESSQTITTVNDYFSNLQKRYK